MLVLMASSLRWTIVSHHERGDLNDFANKMLGDTNTTTAKLGGSVTIGGVDYGIGVPA